MVAFVRFSKIKRGQCIRGLVVVMVIIKIVISIIKLKFTRECGGGGVGREDLRVSECEAA